MLVTRQQNNGGNLTVVPVRLRQLTVVSDPLAVDKVIVFYYGGFCTCYIKQFDACNNNKYLKT